MARKLVQIATSIFVFLLGYVLHAVAMAAVDELDKSEREYQKLRERSRQHEWKINMLTNTLRIHMTEPKKKHRVFGKAW